MPCHFKSGFYGLVHIHSQPYSYPLSTYLKTNKQNKINNNKTKKETDKQTNKRKKKKSFEYLHISFENNNVKELEQGF